jgi:predicted O-linked N-acetylglucosamine transferase (SPINDLY family)
VTSAADATSALRAGVALLRNQQVGSAEALLEPLARESGSALAWHYLGVARHLLHKRPSAIEAFRQSLARDDSNPDTYAALAVVLGQLGNWAEAEGVLLEGLKRLPDHPGLHFNIAVALENRGAHTQALRHYDATLAEEPGHPGALLNRGALHFRHDRHASALADFDLLVAHEPDSVDGLVNRARALLKLHRDDEALQTSRAALRLAPEHRDARLCAAITIASTGNLEAATREARNLDPTWNAAAVYAARALLRQDICLWHDRDRAMEVVRRLLHGPDAGACLNDSGVYMRMLAMPFTGDELRIAANAVAAAVTAAPASAPLVVPVGRERVRIGLICEGVGRHPETYLLRRIASDVDRSRFEVRLYALNRDDGTVLRQDFAARAEAFADLSNLDSGAIVDCLRREELDVAFDAAGYFLPGRPEIFKARVAPIQVAYLATPGPHGEGLMDYRLSDALTTPSELQPLWTEKLVLLPAPHWIHDNSNVIGPPGSREDHGLPRQGFVFCCITQAWKLEPESFSIWMRLLRALEGSVLWLLDCGEATNGNLRAAAEARGVAAERLVFAPRVELEAHLGRLQHAGLFLDTFYFNAQTTAIDALWAGVPLITRTRTTMASRLASTFVRSAGLETLITDSSDAYEAMALRLATHPIELARCREALVAARRSAPLFDTAARIRAFERAVDAMVARQRAGLPPEMLVVE